MACYFFENIWQDDKRQYSEDNLLFQVYQRMVLGKLKDTHHLQVSLAGHLLKGLYEKLICKLFLKNVFQKIQTKDFSLDSAFEAIGILQRELQSSIEYLPFTVRGIIALLKKD